MTTSYHDPKELIFIQSRAEIDPTTVAEYAHMMNDGVGFDPAQAISDGKKIYVWDGYHRGEAARQTGKLLFLTVKPGTREEAEWLALGANQKHGLRRSNKDKQKIIKLALLHPVGVKLADREIARHCGVDHVTVGRIRKELETTGEIHQSEIRVGKDGREINTANIGSNPPAPPAPTGETYGQSNDEPEWLEEAGGASLTDAVMALPEEEKDIVINDPETYAAMGREQVAAGLAEADSDADEPEVPAPAQATAPPPPPPPPPPPAPRPVAPPDWLLTVTFKSTGVCLATLTQAGQTTPAANLSIHKSTVLAQIGETLTTYVPFYANGKADVQ